MNFDFTVLSTNEFELPDGWSVVTVGDVATINEVSIQAGYDHEWIEYIDIASVERGMVKTTQQVRVKEAPSRARRIVRDNDTLISTVRPNLEHYVFVKKANPNLVASTGFAVVSARRADPQFIYYYLTTKPFTEYLTRIADSHTSAYPSFNPDVIAKAELLLPPDGQQRAIAHILGTLDEKIELNRRMNSTLEAIARAMFRSWFVDFDPVRAKAEGRDPGLAKPLADLFPDSFEDPELGEIPKGWRVGTLGDVAEHPRRGVQPSEIEASTPYIALEHMPRRCIALSEWGTAYGLESNKFEFKEGEILFGKLRPYFHKVGVAPLDGVCSTDIVVVTPRAERWFGFVLGHVSSTSFVEHTNAGSTGTKMPRTSWGEMARYVVVLPPDPIANAFTEQIRPAVARILASIHQSRSLAVLRDALLPKLISGELPIKDAKRIIADRT